MPRIIDPADGVQRDQLSMEEIRKVDDAHAVHPRLRVSPSAGIDERRSWPSYLLLRAVPLQVFYTVRSERLLMEQMNYNLLFRWFVGLEMDEPVWNHAVFSKNRERVLNQEVAQEFFGRVLAQAKPHLSDEHFSVDGTLIEAWASQKSLQKKDGGMTSRPGSFVVRSVAMRHTNRKLMRMRGCTGKGTGRRPSWGIWARLSFSLNAFARWVTSTDPPAAAMLQLAIVGSGKKTLNTA